MAKKFLVFFLILITLITSVPFLSGTAAGVNVTIDEIIQTASDIIRENEGTYSSVNPNDNGALSIGWIQWHATRALDLLKDIVAANPTNAKKILGTALHKEITTKKSWSTRTLTAAEAKKISTLISTDEGKAEQDKLAAKDISTYINRAMGYGIKDPTALVYYADIENQCGAGGAKPTAEAAKKLAGSYAKVKLTHLYKASLSDRIAGAYATRRQKTYNNCLLVKWEVVASDLEVWNIVSARNVRSTPDTDSALITTLAKNTMVVISEKAAFDGLTRGKTSMGWITLDTASCTLNTKLSGGSVPAPVIFNTNAGSFNAKNPATATATGINKQRTANTLIVYTNDYKSKSTTTNSYGSECRIDKNGLVLDTPKYGTCKTEIPKGGLVLSAIGTKHQWLIQNVKKGYYVRFDEETKTVSVYKSQNDMLALTKTSVNGKAVGSLPTPTHAKSNYNFTGWTDTGGKAVTTKTVCSSPYCLVLTANWKKIEYHKIDFDSAGGTVSGVTTKIVDGVNIARAANKLVIYKGSATSGTNKYGREAIVDKNGYVLAVKNKGECNNAIPSGGFVVSGNGTGSVWISENLSTNKRLFFDEASKTLTVYETSALYDSFHKSIKERTAIGVTLPTATKTNHKFLGWYTSSGTKITSGTLMPDGGLKAIAKWEPIPGKLSFDANGGTIKSLIATTTVKGTNVHRAKDTIVLYKEKATTGTNSHGTEVLVGSDGIVDMVFPYGVCNNKIPEGSYILSGGGTGSAWLRKNVSVGNYITVKGSSVTVWKNKTEYSSSLNTTVTYGKKYGALPTPQRSGYYFAGWTAPDGKIVTDSTLAAHYGNVTLRAKWDKAYTVTFSPSQGSIVSSTVSAKANGINVQRTLDTLVIYAGLSATGTNRYGTEAVVSADGTVTAVVKNKGNTSIPAGSTVISGNGKMSTWITNNVKVGSYVVINGYNVTVYASKQASDALDGKMSARAGYALGALAVAQRKNYTLVGWFKGSTQYTQSTVINADTVLTAKWAKTSGIAVFDAQGGKINGAVGKYTLSGVNVYRKPDSLVLYNSDYADGTTTTNPYGAEAAVGSNGTVKTTPKYGTCKTAIPKNGYVLSGIGKGYAWLRDNVKSGYYIRYNKNANTVTSYRTYGDYLAEAGKKLTYGKTYGILPTPVRAGYMFVGWKNSQGIIVTSTTKVPDCSDTGLTAVWKKLHSVTYDLSGGALYSSEALLHGTNVHRATDTIVLYKDKASTGTNKYGTEAVVSNSGKVVEIFPYGKGNNKIPGGCYILSGNGNMSRWVQDDLAAGKYVEVRDGKILVYENEVSFRYATQSITVPNDSVIGTLPVPKKFGYTFDGWYNGTVKVTSATKITKNTKLTASWKGVLVSLVYNTNGGAIPAAKAVTANGINIFRALNNIIIYNSADSRTTTGTNKYGTEALVDASGKVIEIRPHGKGNSTIPENGYVISGNGTGSKWIQDNIAVGSYIVTKGTSVTVYNNVGHYYGVVGKKLYVDKIFGALPTPTRSGYTFLGWYLPDGKSAGTNTRVPPAEGTLVLLAKWKKNA